MRRFTIAIRFALTGFLVATPISAVHIDWVMVGDPGNAAHTTGYGAVADTYAISKFEVTNAQYAEFLYAVAATDTYGLYSAEMGSGYGGITRSGTSGNYTYSAIAGRENMPVNFVSWYDSLRFANWLHNGQPTGAQDSTTTEDGAYTFSSATSVGTRNAGATISLPAVDEWYKAAYYDAGSASYFDYPACSDTPTTCALPGPTANTANCFIWPAVGDLTDVGNYTGSASPYGTFDQGGNIYEWDETIFGTVGQVRGLWGGSFDRGADYLASWQRQAGSPTHELEWIGFRVVNVPEPGGGLLLRTGLLVLAGCRRGRV